MESEEARRPTFEEDAGRRAASAEEGDARLVGSCETEDTASPHVGQKRADPAISDEQDGQRTNSEGF